MDWGEACLSQIALPQKPRLDSVGRVSGRLNGGVRILLGLGLRSLREEVYFRHFAGNTVVKRKSGELPQRLDILLVKIKSK